MTGQDALLARAKALAAGETRAAIAIDGMAASGKTTLANALSEAIPESAVVHMDDFTLPFEDRFSGYYDALNANADAARFDREVLSPFLAGQRAVYRPYVCHPVAGFLAPIEIPQQTRLLIVEGAYCLHASLFDRYALRALSLIAPEMQRRRILARNGEAMLSRFLNDFIPMENAHIARQQLKSRCDLILTAE